MQIFSDKEQKVEQQKYKKNLQFGMQRSMRKFQISDKIGEGKPATVVKEIGAIKKKPDTLQYGKNHPTHRRLQGIKLKTHWKSMP